MIRYDCQQLSGTWWSCRFGDFRELNGPHVPAPITASNVHMIMSGTGKLSESQPRYMRALIDASLGRGQPSILTEGYQSPAMAAGRDREPHARDEFAKRHQDRYVVQTTGCCVTDDHRFLVSPDALAIGFDRDWAGVEIKCPNRATHEKYLRDGTIPMRYKPQVEFARLVLGCRTLWFFSHYPELPPLEIEVFGSRYSITLARAVFAFHKEYMAELAKARKV